MITINSTFRRFVLFNKFVAVLLLGCGLQAQDVQPQSRDQYKVGDIVDDVALVDHTTGGTVNLYDFEGSVLFLEWFAWWCPFCRAAAADVEPGIVQYYEAAGGNKNGIPVKHIGLNLQSGQPIQSQNFIDTYHLGTVLNDFNRVFSNRFQTGGQPIFAIINGVKDTAGHRQWELLYTRNGYGDLSQPISTFRAAIDQVEPSAGGLTYGQWTSSFALNADQSSANADPDNDGLVNAWEFATGTDPLDAGSFHRPSHLVHSDLTAVIVFQAAQNLTGVNWRVYRSDDLIDWTPYLMPTVSSSDQANPESKVQEIEVILPVDQGKLGFYRVEAVFE